MGVLIGAAESTGVLYRNSAHGKIPIFMLQGEITTVATAVVFHGVGLALAALISAPLVRVLWRKVGRGGDRPVLPAVYVLLLGHAWMLLTSGMWIYDPLGLIGAGRFNGAAHAGLAVGLSAAVLGLVHLATRSTVAARRVGGVLRAAAAAAVVASGLWTWDSSRLPAPDAVPASSRSDPRPNVLLVVLDTVRADYLSGYGHPRITSPNLDKLAADAVLFEQASTCCGWTPPAHASLFTGLFQTQHHMVYGKTRLGDEFVTLAELLHDAGYQTVGASTNMWLTKQSGFAQGFEDWFDVGGFEPGLTYLSKLAAYRWHRAWAGRFGYRLGLPLLPSLEYDKGGKDALTLLFNWFASKRDPKRPFFLFLNLFEAHATWAPPIRHRRRFVATGDMAYSYVVGDDPPNRFAPENVDRRRARVWRQLYEAEIRYDDELLGVLLDFVRRSGLWDRTAIIVTADHGEQLGEHGVWGHNEGAYESLARVPLVIRCPPDLIGGKRVDRIVQITDLFGTILHLGGLTEGLHGPLGPRDLSRIDQPGDWSDQAVLEFPDGRRIRDDRPSAARPAWGYRSGDWKLINQAGQPDELYRLDRDPTERRSVATDEPRQLEIMRRRHLQWVHTAQQNAAPQEAAKRAVPLGVQDMQRLRDLGYVQ